MLSFVDITVSINGIKLIDKLSGECQRGQILAITGPHDSGKSTLLKILAGLIRQDEGHVLFDGENFNLKTLRKIAYLPNERGLYPRAKVYDLIMYFAQLRDMDLHDAKIKSVRLMDKFNVTHYSKWRIYDLDKQDIQKIEVILSLIHDPDFIIFDEPFKGLDIYNQDLLIGLFDELKKENKVIIIASHQLDIIDNISQNLLLMHNGRNILSGNLKQILYQQYEDYIKIIAEDNEQIDFYLKSSDEIKSYKKIINEYHIVLKKNSDKQIFLQKLSQVTTIYQYQIALPNLRDLILQKIPQEKAIS